MALVIPAAPPARAPRALNPANIGISGNAPPTLVDIEITLGMTNLPFPPIFFIADRAACRADFMTLPGAVRKPLLAHHKFCL